MFKILSAGLAGVVLFFSGCVNTVDSLHTYDYISLDYVADIDSEVSKTSGLINIDGRLFTHNDGDGEAYLYEVNATTGFVERKIYVTGATNVDWEDLAYDGKYVYIGDIGNALGSRKDLKIYKILGDDLLKYTTVNTEIISFTYGDQVSFSYEPNTTPYDAEALIVFNGELYIFTKNWEDYTTNIYRLPTRSGYYLNIMPIAEYTFEVMITGASADRDTNSIALVGYANPYDYTVAQVNEVIVLTDFASTNFFTGSIATYEVSNVQSNTKLEGIVYKQPSELYLTTEVVDPYPATLYKATLTQ